MSWQTVDNIIIKALCIIIVLSINISSAAPIPTILFDGKFSPTDVRTGDGIGMHPFGLYDYWSCLQRDDSLVVVSAPGGRNGYVGKFNVNPGDGNICGGGTSTERAEVGKLINDHYDLWYGISTMLPSDFRFGNTWHLFFQSLTGGHTGRPDMSLYFDDGGRVFLGMNPGTGSVIDQYILSYIKPGIWHDWIVHIKWTQSNNGLVEVYHREAGQTTYTKLVTKVGRTANGNPFDIQTKNGLYRESLSYSQTLYSSGFKIGTTMADVEYGPATAPVQTPVPTPKPTPTPEPTEPIEPSQSFDITGAISSGFVYGFNLILISIADQTLDNLGMDSTTATTEMVNLMVKPNDFLGNEFVQKEKNFTSFWYEVAYIMFIMIGGIFLMKESTSQPKGFGIKETSWRNTYFSTAISAPLIWAFYLYSLNWIYSLEYIISKGVFLELMDIIPPTPDNAVGYFVLELQSAAGILFGYHRYLIVGLVSAYFLFIVVLYYIPLTMAIGSFLIEYGLLMLFSRFIVVIIFLGGIGLFKSTDIFPGDNHFAVYFIVLLTALAFEIICVLYPLKLIFTVSARKGPVRITM